MVEFVGMLVGLNDGIIVGIFVGYIAGIFDGFKDVLMLDLYDYLLV